MRISLFTWWFQRPRRAQRLWNGRSSVKMEKLLHTFTNCNTLFMLHLPYTCLNRSLNKGHLEPPVAKASRLTRQWLFSCTEITLLLSSLLSFLLLGVLSQATGLLQWGSSLFLKKKASNTFSQYLNVCCARYYEVSNVPDDIRDYAKMSCLSVCFWQQLKVEQQFSPSAEACLAAAPLVNATVKFTWGLILDAMLVFCPCWGLHEQSCWSHGKNREAMM